MNAEQCGHLVELIVQTWPHGPRGRIWTDALGDLEHTHALAVYRQLRNADETAPTIARFLRIYRDVDQPTTTPTTRPANHGEHCPTCRGSGWQPGPDIVQHLRDGTIARTYTTVEPCRGPQGQLTP